MISILIPIRNKRSILEVLINLSELDLDFEVEIILIISYDGYKSFDLDLIMSNPGFEISKILLVNQDYFCKASLLNIGIHEANYSYILNLDADILISSRILNLWGTYIDQNTFITPRYVQESANADLRGAPGIVLAPKARIKEINGLSMKFMGWGLEDRDYLRRLKTVCKTFLKIGTLVHLTHDDFERIKNYEIKTKSQSRNANMITFRDRVIRNDNQGSLMQLPEYTKIEYNEFS